MKRTVTHLADGRELIYFDERDDASRDAVDQRELPPPPPASEMRHDPILDEWVAIATHRQTRIYKPPSDECPLCPSTPQWQSEIPAPEYDVVVFENRFPSFSHRVGPAQDDVLPGLVPARGAAGRCEVVCFTSDHSASFSSLSRQRVRTVMEAWADRTADLATRDDVEQVFCFENRGEEIGVTLSHPHGQIYAYPFVTPRTRRMLESARRYTRGNLFADVLAAEQADGRRIVAENGLWTAFVPATARWPFEIHLYPRRQTPDIPSLTTAERDAFGPLYLEVLRRLDGMFGLPMPYIAAWHQAPVRVDRDLAYLHLQLFSTRRAPGKLKYLAGSESGMGVFVNDVRPEQAAEMLRGVTL
ncbi:galactose-1-phosphate uridylyltransferase [Dactylosporangium sp. AC04546]|uniref:galactose-1-phosphate uridylyltransferase n=1 Tax=Dactylosporangium sp. AC04546 TaxID=2862460 RepID=UPI001EE0C9D2|nr:galactose-1-phosphate uridylyltransferase [Dactylosporangium sp. AC04546]WVK82374.1 galactose-1-phosphate uridylyltransferase [Dactylosporangium sp. AC04546]